MKLIRRIGTAVKWLAIVLGVLILAAAAYEQVGAWRDRRVLEQVGHSVDVGGRSLNISCSGQGSPAVIFVSGRTSPGYSWTPIQRGVSRFTEACWYDRAGLGWSDRGPDPSWGDAAARDLHVLLTKGGPNPPFVLVGASFGGYVIRFYNDAHPEEVSAMVFVDAAHEDAGTIEGIPHRDRPELPRSVIRGLSVVLGRLGMMRLLQRDPGPPAVGWTPEEWDVLFRLRRQRDRLVADAQEGPESATAERVRSTGKLENMPMIVLAQGRQLPDSASVEAGVLRGWVGLQKELTSRSSRGRLRVVANSGHGIPLEAPDTVITAVRDIVAELRGSLRSTETRTVSTIRR